jgi:RimJ/RimL family protein N-acetyltransferase
MPPRTAASIDLPMPIRTPRLLIRTKQLEDSVQTAAAVHETWDDLHRWMHWAENPKAFTPETMEARYRQVIAMPFPAAFIEFIGVEIAAQIPVVWCGFHDIDWEARRCDTGFWVRKIAHGRGFATEAANALLRYAFEALRMKRVGLTHSKGNQASRRIAEKLGFHFDGIQPGANPLPGGRFADRYCYSRLDARGLPPLEVQWGSL